MDGSGCPRNSQPLCADAATRAALSAPGPIRCGYGCGTESYRCSKEPDAVDLSRGTAVFSANPSAITANPSVARCRSQSRQLRSDSATLGTRRDRDGTASRDSRFGTRQNVQDVDA